MEFPQPGEDSEPHQATARSSKEKLRFAEIDVEDSKDASTPMQQETPSMKKTRSGTMQDRRSMSAEEQVSALLQLVGQTHQQVESLLELDNREMEGHLDHAANLHNGLLVERHARELLGSESGEAVRKVYRSVTQGLHDARSDRHDTTYQLEALADKRIAELMGIQSEELGTQGESQQYAQEIQAEVGNLYKAIHKAKGYRLEKGQKLGEAVRQKLSEVEEAIAAERRFRTDSQSTLLELFGQMGEKMEQEMEACRRERLASTNRILSVIETVLPRVEAARHSQADNMTERVEDSGDAAAIARAVASNMAASKGDIQKRKSMLFKGRLVNVG